MTERDARPGRTEGAPDARLVRILSLLGSGVALLLALFHLYTATFGTFVAIEQRSFHLAIAAALVFLIHPLGKGSELNVSMDLMLAILAAAAFMYVAYNEEAIQQRMTFITPLPLHELLLGALGILVVLEAARRSLGWTMAILPVIAISYAILGDSWSGALSHRGFTLSQVIEYMYLGTEGIFGIPVGIAATYLILLVLFGTVLERSGVGTFIMDLALALAGRSRGGPAQVAVIASALFGSVSGSSVANVYASGSSSIPLMKRCGYSPAFAGSVEAVASTGGQLVPPVLGAAAFVMADMIGIPYVEIIKASAIPAFLFFVSVGVMVHFEAMLHGMKPLPQTDIPRLRDVLKHSYMLLPLVGICVALFSGYTVSRSALIGIGLAWIVSLPRRETRLGPKKLVAALILGAQRGVAISIATACASLIVGVFTLTGLGLSLTSLVALAFQDYLPLALLCTAVASLILGMGVPTVVAYLLVASLVTPMLGRLDVPILSAHMFAFYFGILSMITPPVAMASWAGAQLAGSNFLQTSLQSSKLGSVAFLMPFVFIYQPALLGRGDIGQILIALTTGLIGVVAISAAIQGWLLARAGCLARTVLLAAGFGLFWPSLSSNAVGLLLLAAVALTQLRDRAAPHVP
jgi:TRAP transporter 4TM/12TM fusion protein